MSEAKKLSSVYGGGNVTLRVLRALGWGPALLNLGYFVARGPLNFLNLLPSRFRLASCQQRLVRRAVEFLQLGSGDRVLDIACGRGWSSYFMASAYPGVDVNGIDLLPANVAVAETLFGQTRGLRYEVNDAQRLKCRDASFDKALCLEAAFHFPDRQRFLAEAYRVLRPGGKLVLVDFMWKTRGEALKADDDSFALVRETWEFEDFLAEGEYLDAAKSVGFLIGSRFDWTSRVIRPLQGQFDVLARLGQSAWGRRLVGQSHLAMRALSRGDWRELAKAAAAHKRVHAAARYMVFVLEKPA